MPEPIRPPRGSSSEHQRGSPVPDGWVVRFTCAFQAQDGTRVWGGYNPRDVLLMQCLGVSSLDGTLEAIRKFFG
jgi:hypothetical protein